MLTALTRKPSPALGRCELEYLSRHPIDIGRAIAQHEQYEACLAELGVRVISLPAEPELPDAVFVEDLAVVVDEVAVITRTGAESRRKEATSIADALSPFRPIHWLQPPTTLEGGDVMRAGRTIFVGVSTRTNAAGIAQLTSELEPHGYSVCPVEVRNCLHLKTGCCYLGDAKILANRTWIDTVSFGKFDIIDVAPDEPWSANVLRIGEIVIVPKSFPGTARILEQAGYQVRPIDISELMKAEGGLTCLSVIFEGG